MWEFLLTCFCFLGISNAFPEIGHWDIPMPMSSSMLFPKSVFENTEVSAKITCAKPVLVRFVMTTYYSECADAFAYIKEPQNGTKTALLFPIGLPKETVEKKEEPFHCHPTEAKTISTNTTRAGAQMTEVSVFCVNPIECIGSQSGRIIVDIKSDYGYLSAIEFPLRSFYGLLSFGYGLLCFLWLCFTFCHWKDLLRIQYYITLMLFIGLVEQLTFFGLYENLNRTGITLKSALIFALLISCFKRTLARFLILIVCVGYGITKSRLGTAYRRIVWICVAYLLCSLLDSGLRAFQPRFKPSLSVVLGGLPAIGIDLAILWWSFSYLVSTLRETRMRRNAVKHRLYRSFSALLIVVALISMVCMFASIFLLHWRPCTRAWRYIWFDETFWQLLFYIVLFAIVILWRPSSTNRLYASSAFLDPDVEPPAEDLEERLLDAIISGINDDDTSSSRKNSKAVASEDDALRWAEENIPSTQDQGNHDKLSSSAAAAAMQMKLD